MLRRADTDTQHIDRELLRLVRSRISRNRGNVAQGQSGAAGGVARGSVTIEKRQSKDGSNFFQADISVADGMDKIAP